MKNVKISDISIALEDEGVGIPLLFIHGYPLNRQLWKSQVEGLSEIARVLTPDLRGHGDSTSGRFAGSDYPPYFMEMLADDCAQLLDALEINQPIILCGLSMGGYISFSFYKKYPHRVAGLILAATRSSADSPAARENRIKAVNILKSSGSDAIIDSMLPMLLSPATLGENSAMVDYVKEMMNSVSLEGMIGDLLGMMERPDSTPLLADIHVPTLILMGMDDQIIPMPEAEAMHAKIANSKLILLPQAGHLLNLEQPELFNDAVRSFLNSTMRGNL